jgi:CheY-like chemotaxis protein
MRNLKVLLVGRGFEQAKTTLSHLAECGCQYQCASSLPDATRLVREQTFDLVLDAIYEDGHNISSLREALRGAPTTLLYSHEVEDGFWWILGLDRGRPCVGEAPAITPGEFSQVLDLVLAELMADGTVMARILRWLSSIEPRLPEARIGQKVTFLPAQVRAFLAISQ